MTAIDPAILALAATRLPGAAEVPRDGWAHRVEAVIRHGLTGFLASAWADDRVELDDRTVGRMQRQLEAEAIRGVQLEGELIRLETVMATEPCVVLKGPVLAHGAYAHPMLRPFTDIDLLTTGEHLQPLIDRLTEYGYERTRPEPAAGFDARVAKALTLEHPGGVVIDLHRTLAAGTAGARIDVGALVASRVWMPVGPVSIPAPTWEAHLIETALHAVVGDGLERAISLRDVAQVAIRPDLDVDEVLELARNWEVVGPVGTALHEATSAFGCALPPALLDLAAERSARTPPAHRAVAARSAKRRLDELAHGDLRSRLILSRALLAPSPAFLRWTYGSQPLAALYARRWIDLAQRVGDARTRDAAVAPAPRRLPEVAASPGTPSRARPGPQGTVVSRRSTTEPVARRSHDGSSPTVTLRARPARETVTVAGALPRATAASPTEADAEFNLPRQQRWSRARPPRPAATSGHGAGPPPHDTAPPDRDDVPDRPPPTPSAAATARPMPRGRNGVSLFAGGIGILVVTALAAQLGIDHAGIVLVPAAAICFAVAASRRIVEKHPDEAWVGRWLVAGIFAKLLASYARYLTLVIEYGGRGDAVDYDANGRLFVDAWRNGAAPPDHDGLRKTEFVRWFTGVVYYLFGSNMVAGFFIFGLLAAAGSYFWYRATADAVPMLDKRIYFALVLFAPSIAFWPSSIGKEALMQFGIGVMAMGTSLILRQRLVPGLALGLAGGWLLWVVRPHLLALVTIGAGCAYLVGRVRPEKGEAPSLVGRPIGMLIIILLVAFTVSEGAEFLGLEDLSISSIEASLDEQTATTGQGGSSFDNGGNSLNPVNLPMGAVTVLLRPFPWETDSAFQLLASLESAMLAAFIFMRLPSLKRALVSARGTPFLLYCWILTLLYSATFSSFANFGILVRQRSLVLPALFVLLAVRPRSDDETDDVPLTRAEVADRPGNGA